MKSELKQLAVELTRLENYELYSLDFISVGGGLNLGFWYGGAEQSKVQLQLEGLLHVVFSKAPGDEGAGLYVGEVEITELTDGGKELFSRLSYSFVEQNGEMANYPLLRLFHVHVEGEVCIDVVCTDICLSRTGCQIII